MSRVKFVVVLASPARLVSEWHDDRPARQKGTRWPQGFR